MYNKYDALAQRLKLRFIGPPIQVGEPELSAVEKVLALPLPSDYRMFVAKYGLTAGDDLAFPDYQHPERLGGGVGVFYGVRPGKTYDLLDEREGMEDRIPQRLLAIADSPGGQICVSLCGADVGKIYWWGFEDSRPRDQPLSLIGDDFDSFVNRLYCD